MYRHSVDLEGQDAGLDMFVGSGIDFLSEVNMEDLEMDTDFFRSSRPGQLSPETFVNYAPLAASLGPPGTGLRLGSDSAQTADTQPAQWNFRTPAAPAQPASLTAGVSQCTPPQPSGNSLMPHISHTLENLSTSQAGHSADAADTAEAGFGASEPLDSRAKLRDKNKRAQKRFRERKKEKAQETEKYMSELTAEMEKVKLEKNKLEERNQLLEKVLSLSKQDAPPPTKGMLELSPDTLKGITNPFGVKLDHFPPDKTLPVSVLQTEPKSMTVRDVKSMSLEQHIIIWKDYVSKLAGLLVSAGGDPDSEAGVAVQSTIQEAITMCSCKAMHDPYGLQHFFMARMEEGKRINKQKDPQPAPPMAEMMANVLKALNLTDQQKCELMELRQWVLPRVGRLMRERERLSRQLQTCTQDDYHQASLFFT